ncbi:hypothetical protein ONE63_000516 [Megalurothrips usitatus]|uniref:Tetraspanin n=1 Tax=Megalurothrips usitatus TaxID=439358 RepID=A0AAV7XZS0_9NEOP|nr:hypothetical protein ONE63_000516 [Megalurothrips usitatus]
MGRSGYTCVRHVFCSLNVFVWLAGCAILGVGIWLRLAYEGYTNLLPQYSLLSADCSFIAIGVVTFVVAFFGCCGAWFQSHCMLVTYFSLVIFMFLVEFMFATLAFVFRSVLGTFMVDELQNGIRLHYNSSSKNALHNLWSHVHREFHCCGVQEYTDWYNINAWPKEQWVPNSCCLPRFANTTGEAGGPGSEPGYCGRTGSADMWYPKGCSEQVQMWFLDRLHIVGIVGLVVAFIQLFGLISSMLLFCTVRHKRSGQTYKSYDHAS